MKLAATTQKINYYLSLVVMFATPLLFLPTTSEFYEMNKQALLIIVALVSFVLWSISFISERQVKIVRSPLGLPVIGLVVSWTISAFLKSPNKFDALFDPNQLGTIAGLGLLFFTAINSFRAKKQVETAVGTIVASIALLAATTLLWASNLMPKVLPASFLQSPIWTPTGNSISTLALLVLFAVFMAILIIKGRTQFAAAKVTMISVVLAITVGAAGLLTYQLFFNPSLARPVFLSQSASWSIALEALKTSPIFGTGPATYLSDFTSFRPISYNLTNNWAIRFASSSNYYLQLLSTVGILGFAAYVLIAVRTTKLFSKSFKTSSESPLHAIAIASSSTALLAFVGQLFIPVSFVYLATIFFLLIITTTTFKQLGSSLVHDANIDIVAASETGGKSPILPWVSLVFSLILLAPTLYFGGRLYTAEMLFQKSLMSASTNDGKATYDTLIKAINIFPYKDSYRVAYSNVNLLLANSIAASKKDLSADDKNTVTQLIQQAIREAKNAVALNPNKVTNVENLAGVYRQLLTLAKGADSWTVASYQRAIQLDPSNPNLRIALGGVLYSLKSYDEAIRMFQSAADLKPDLANAYYNIAAAYKEKADYARAYANLQTVVSLVNKDSADYTKALAELEELKSKVNDKASTSSAQEPAKTNLNKPEPLPTSKAQIQLPADLGPDTTITPTPSETPKTSITPAPTR